MTTMTGEDWAKISETIIEFETENPHQKASKIAAKYDSIKMAKTVGEAKERGAKAWDLVDWYKRGALKVLVELESKG